ncbi:transcription factor bHLH95-like [Capsicum annuum]
MNEGGENDFLIWENDEVWSFLNSDNGQLDGSSVEFVGDKLPDPNRSNTCQALTTVKEVGEASLDGKKKCRSNEKKGTNESCEPKSGADGDGGRESSHELHIRTERERRKRMRNMFEELQTLLPHLQPKADKSSIVDETVRYIKMLENTVDNLKEQKLERIQLGIARLSIMNNPVMTPQKLRVGTSWEQFLADKGSASNSAAITPKNNNNVTGIPLLNTNVPTDFETWSSDNVVLNVCGEEAHISVCCPKKPGLFTFICLVLEKNKIDIVHADVSSDQFRNLFMIQTHARGASGLEQLISGALSVEDMYKQAAHEIMSGINPK